jgi:hypothetical protein
VLKLFHMLVRHGWLHNNNFWYPPDKTPLQGFLRAMHPRSELGSFGCKANALYEQHLLTPTPYTATLSPTHARPS